MRIQKQCIAMAMVHAFNWNPKDQMCPSWKGTRLRTHSPKGRASLIREWLKQLSLINIDPTEIARDVETRPSIIFFPSRLKNSIDKIRGKYDFNHEIYDVMQGCLACKSCTGQCPC